MLKNELEQLKEKYHSQLGEGVRIKREVSDFEGRVHTCKYSGISGLQTPTSP